MKITSGPHQDDSFRGKWPFSEMSWMIFDDVGVTNGVLPGQIHISKLSCLVHVLLVPCRVSCTQMLFFCFVAISVLWPIPQKTQNPGGNSWCVRRRPYMKGCQVLAWLWKIFNKHKVAPWDGDSCYILWAQELDQDIAWNMFSSTYSVCHRWG